MIAAVWAMLRAVDGGRTRWLLLSGVFVGLGYLTKQLQIMLIAPALGLTYLFAGPPRLRKRLGQSIIAIGAAVVAAGWWVLLVGLWPADERPWIGGTTHNSVMELTFGYNGFGRLTGNEPGSTAGLVAHRPGAATHPVWGVPGIGRMFQPAQAAEIGWLLPTALLFVVVLLAWRWRAPRTDARRAQVLVWGGWLLCTWLVFSFMAGIFHPYYTAALAPAVGGAGRYRGRGVLAAAPIPLGANGTGGRGDHRGGDGVRCADPLSALPPLAALAGDRCGGGRGAVVVRGRDTVGRDAGEHESWLWCRSRWWPWRVRRRSH